jgi:outer membrane immunogenic protein
VPLGDGTNSGTSAVSDDDNRSGWTVGGGLEWMFAPNWSLKVEYLYYDLGTVSVDQTVATYNGEGIRVSCTDIHSEAHYHGNILRVGLNYQFH